MQTQLDPTSRCSPLTSINYLKRHSLYPGTCRSPEKTTFTAPRVDKGQAKGENNCSRRTIDSMSHSRELQHNFSKFLPVAVFSKESRERKAKTMIAVLRDFLKEDLETLSLLDLGLHRALLLVTFPIISKKLWPLISTGQQSNLPREMPQGKIWSLRLSTL